MPSISHFYGITIWMYWDELHADELNADWELATGGKPLNQIDPLR
jgi:hypothetical protein